MISKMDWKSTLSKVAPMLGAAVGGPFGAMAASEALKLLDIEPEENAAEEQLERVIASMNPEQAGKLVMAEKNWLATMEELNLKEEDLHAKDRASARNFAIETNIAPQIILSMLYTVGYIAVLYMFLKGGVAVADSIKSEFNMILGVLTAGQVQIMNFWFGSSSGSKDKANKLKG